MNPNLNMARGLLIGLVLSLLLFWLPLGLIVVAC